MTAMKKWLMGMVMAAVAVSLAACTPTTEKKQTETEAQGSMDMGQVPMSTGGASDKVPDPNVDPVAIVSIYHGSDVEDGIKQSMDSLSTTEMDAQEMVDKLVEYGVLTKGTEVLEFTVDGSGENATAVLDLNKAESDEGSSDHKLLAEIGNTFIENYQLESLKLKVNGGNFAGDEIKQGDGDVLTYVVDYDTVE